MLRERPLHENAKSRSKNLSYAPPRDKLDNKLGRMHSLQHHSFNIASSLGFFSSNITEIPLCELYIARRF